MLCVCFLAWPCLEPGLCVCFFLWSPLWARTVIQALVEITRSDLVWSGENVDERLQKAYSDFTKICRSHKVVNRGLVFSEILVQK